MHDGKGIIDNCEACGKETHTKVVRADDEPVFYAHCKECRGRIQKAIERERELDYYES